MRAFCFFVVVLFLIITATAGANKKCFLGDGDDTFGAWYNTTSLSVERITSTFTDLQAEGNATLDMLLQYKRLWLPNECTTIRYTKALAEKHLAKLARKEQRKTINVAFFGESALRGLYCSIGRIFAGSEINGENINNVCGGKHVDGNFRKVRVPVSLADKGKVTAGVALSPVFNSTFTYTTFFDAHLYFQAKQLMTVRSEQDRLYAVVIATGAWDFHDPMHAHLGQLGLRDFEYPYTNATAECLNDQYDAVRKERTNVYVTNFFIPELSKLAKANNVRLMYRNNHYNSRFGVKCADEEFEQALRFPGSAWEIIDSRNQSQEHWRDQVHASHTHTHIPTTRDCIKKNSHDVTGKRIDTLHL